MLENTKTPAFTDGFEYINNTDECAKVNIVGIIDVPMFVTAHDVSCIVDAAFSGDSRNWIKEIKVLHDIPDSACISEKVGLGGALLISVDSYLPEHGNKPAAFVLTAAEVVCGLKLYATHSTWNPCLGDIDATIADIIIQYALFGEVIFG